MNEDLFRERLKLALDRAELKPAQASKAAGAGPDLIRNILSGKTGWPRIDTAVALARVLGVSVDWLSGNDKDTDILHNDATISPFPRREKPLKVVSIDRQISVVGRVEAGAWRESVGFEPDEIYQVPVVNDPLINGIPLQGFEVSGTSFNKVYPPGTIVLVASLLDIGRDPLEGEVCLVQRRNRAGLYEATLKQVFTNDDGQRELWPCSTDPKYQDPLVVESTGEDDDVAITGVVVRSLHLPYRGDARHKNGK